MQHKRFTPFACAAFVIATAAMLGGCVKPFKLKPKVRTIIAGDMATPDATLLTAFLVSTGGQVEDTPSGVERSAVLDEGYLQTNGSQRCATVIMRTHVDIDQPLSEWDVTINGNQVYPASRETVSVVDYDYMGTRKVVDAAFLGERIGGALSITKPEAKVFRVVERTASFCMAGVFGQLDLKAQHQPWPDSYFNVLWLQWNFADELGVAMGHPGYPAPMQGQTPVAPPAVPPAAPTGAIGGQPLDFIELKNGGSYKCTILEQDAKMFKIQLLDGKIEVISAADVLRVSKVAL